MDWLPERPAAPHLPSTLLLHAYVAAIRGFRPPESALEKLRPLLEGDESDGDCWRALVSRRAEWINSVCATSNALVALNSGWEVLPKDLASRSIPGVAFNDSSVVTFCGGEEFDLLSSSDTELWQQLLKTSKMVKGQGQGIVDLIWTTPCFVEWSRFRAVLLGLFEMLPAESRLHMHMLPAIPAICSSYAWSTCGLPPVQWHRASLADTFENWAVESRTEEGFVTLRRVKIERNFIVSKGRSSKGPPPAPPPKPGTERATAAAAQAAPAKQQPVAAQPSQSAEKDQQAAHAPIPAVAAAALQVDSSSPPPKARSPLQAEFATSAAPPEAQQEQQSRHFRVDGQDIVLLSERKAAKAPGVEEVGTEIPLHLVVGAMTDFWREKSIPMKNMLMALGRYRALQSECAAFNAAQGESEGQRFLQMISGLGVKLHGRPIHMQSLDALVEALEQHMPNREQHLEDIARGSCEFAGLGESYRPGAQVTTYPDGLGGSALGLTVKQSWYREQQTLFGPKLEFHMEFEFLASIGDSMARIVFQDVYSHYNGHRSLASLPYAPMLANIADQLAKRGARYCEVAVGNSYVGYLAGAFLPMAKAGQAAAKAQGALHSSGRIMLDTERGLKLGHNAAKGGDAASHALQAAFRLYQQAKRQGGTMEHAVLVDKPKREDLWCCWPTIVGFSFTAKCWGQAIMDLTKPIDFRDDAFDRLVLQADRKELIEAVVRCSDDGVTDIVSGKGGSAIFLLHGPPGCGKTLTAEAIAEMLHRPLYTVTAGDLGITAAEVEQNLSAVLQICSEWGALTLIDEADLFLETRTTQEMQRNSVVCVMLRLLEYHQGVLFLTTNRASNVDPAVQSRITVFLHYEALDIAGRATVWHNLLDTLADGHIACAETLSRHPLNGRQIKNALLLGKALAKSRGEPISTVLMERIVQVVGGFEIGTLSPAAVEKESSVMMEVMAQTASPMSPSPAAVEKESTFMMEIVPQTASPMSPQRKALERFPLKTPVACMADLSPVMDRTVSPGRFGHHFSAREFSALASFPPAGTVSHGTPAGGTSARRAHSEHAVSNAWTAVAPAVRGLGAGAAATARTATPTPLASPMTVTRSVAPTLAPLSGGLPTVRSLQSSASAAAMCGGAPGGCGVAAAVAGTVMSQSTSLLQGPTSSRGGGGQVSGGQVSGYSLPPSPALCTRQVMPAMTNSASLPLTSLSATAPPRWR